MRWAIEGLFGAVAWIRGEFVAARRHFEKATAGWNSAGRARGDHVRAGGGVRLRGMRRIDSGLARPSCAGLGA
jgi:hypothetical protein